MNELQGPFLGNGAILVPPSQDRIRIRDIMQVTSGLVSSGGRTGVPRGYAHLSLFSSGAVQGQLPTQQRGGKILIS